MIEIKKLKKEYVVGNNRHTAVDDITFNFPNKGMVFVLGKSGSGKTTLMNLIGGLDSPTSGQIIIDGNEISSFNEKQYEDYRNDYVGFVFQDFFLMENYTIEENISLSLKLKNKQDKELIKHTLTLVDLAGLEHRYPSELSGGQKQRVAIARAIIKNPKLILADEPTGNLDYRTATQILNLLQELSKDRLVLIVSHNKAEAFKYADVLINLEDGKFVNVSSKVENYRETMVLDNTINFPYNIKLSNEELDEINEYIKTGNYTITQDVNHYAEYVEVPQEYENYTISKTKLNHKNKRYFYKKFQDDIFKGSMVTSFMVSILTILLMICFLFGTFNGHTVIENVNEFNQLTELSMEKGYYIKPTTNKLQQGRTVKIFDEEIQTFYDYGYEGNIYKLYTKAIKTNPYNSSLPFESGNNPYFYFEELYVERGSGVLDCDVEFLEHKFAIDGELNVLAGSLEKGFKDNGYVITDYLADCIIHYHLDLKSLSREEAFEKIISMPSIANTFTVKAIVDTQYRERYKELVNVYMKKYDPEQIDSFASEYAKLRETVDYYRFANEAYNSFVVAYYIGEKDLIDSVLEDLWNICPMIRIPFMSLVCKDLGGKESIYERYFIPSSDPDLLKPGEMIIDNDLYNLFFGTSYETSIPQDVPVQNITIKGFDHYGVTGQGLTYTGDFKVISVDHEMSDYFMLINVEDYKAIARTLIYPYSLQFDNVDSASKVYNANSKKLSEFGFKNQTFQALYKTTNIVQSVSIIFFVFFIFLAVSIVILMSSQISRNIKKKTYEIGVLKGLGLKGNVILEVFIKQLIVMILIIISIIGVSLLFVEDLVNQILVTNLKSQLPSILLEELEVISFDYFVIFSVYAFVFLVSLLTTIVLVSSLAKIKPIKIIKSKEL